MISLLDRMTDAAGSARATRAMPGAIQHPNAQEKVTIMNAVAKQAIAKVAAVKASKASTSATKVRGLVPLFPGFASLDFRKSDSLFPGLLELGMWILKSQAASARDTLRTARKERRAMRREARAVRRASRRPFAENSIFNFGIVKCRSNKAATLYRVTFEVAA